MTPRKIKCEYLLKEIAHLEQEREKELMKLELDMGEKETIMVIECLKKIDRQLSELKMLAKKIICIDIDLLDKE